MGHCLIHVGINLSTRTLTSNASPCPQPLVETRFPWAAPRDAHHQHFTWALLTYLLRHGHLGEVCTSSDIRINPDINLLMYCVEWVR